MATLKINTAGVETAPVRKSELPKVMGNLAELTTAPYYEGAVVNLELEGFVITASASSSAIALFRRDILDILVQERVTHGFEGDVLHLYGCE